ncbi:MAG: hypothetical protein AB1Z98_17890 [Nannocystaceae bacterium]
MVPPRPSRPVPPSSRPPGRARWRAALGLAAALASTGALCGPDPGQQPTEAPADTPEERIIQKVHRQLRATGISVDVAKLRIETRARNEISADLGALLELGLRPEHVELLWQLRGVLESTPPVRSLSGLRRRAVEARLPSASVYYATDRRALVFVDPDEQDPEDLEGAAAGGLIYAFYDQGPGGLSEALYDAQGRLDGVRVRQCLLEGHVHLAQMLAWYGDLDQLDDEALEELDPPPTELFATLTETPCGPGSAYLWEKYVDGGWAAVLRAVRSPPVSSEQLMHPAKIDQDFPVNVALPRWPDDEFGDENPYGEATLVHEDMVGELTIHRLLLERGVDPGDAMRAAVGWDGDRVRTYEHASGRVIIWRSAWDREVDAQQFAAAIAPKGIEPRAFRVERHGRVVDAVSGSDPELVGRLHAVLAARTGEPSAQPADAASTASVEAQLPR